MKKIEFFARFPKAELDDYKAYLTIAIRGVEEIQNLDKLAHHLDEMPDDDLWRLIQNTKIFGI